MAFELPPLPYPKNALEPHTSAQTLDFHHGKHHQAYVTNLNNLVKDSPMESQSLEQIIAATAKDASKAGIFNNAAQVWNHTFFWNCMKPQWRRHAERRHRPGDRPRPRRPRQVQGRFQGGRGRPVRQRLGLACRQRRQALDHPDAERGQPALRGPDRAPHLRCVGARLLPRFPEPPARFRPGVSRPPRQLGFRRAEPGKGEVTPPAARRPRPRT